METAGEEIGAAAAAIVKGLRKMNTGRCEHVPRCMTALQPTVPQLGLSSSGICARLPDSVIQGKDKGPNLPGSAGEVALSEVILQSFECFQFCEES